MFRAFFTLLCLVVACMIFTDARAIYEDSQVAASGGDHHGRVQIKVYRGPSEHGEHDHAPWGYWVKQPADDDH